MLVSTLGRLLTRLDGDALDRVTYAYLSHLVEDPTDRAATPASGARRHLTGIAADGKTLRGSRTSDGAVHLLAATRYGP
ncbi:hypothetical protein [Microtetraspora glauca]|uniref:Uncharacterized protein n=1 Tax=Microtetraspora glauca TaxID=1996 RepID=A0ABV3GHY4_MICGL